MPDLPLQVQFMARLQPLVGVQARNSHGSRVACSMPPMAAAAICAISSSLIT
jgi:hypothetical protein